MNASVSLGGFLSRAERRRIKALAPTVGRITDGDAQFFDRHRDREFRVRLAGRAEVETDLILKGLGDLPLVPGAQWTTVVRQIAPGVRLRIVTQSIGRDAADFDMGEDLARWAYDQLVVPGSYAHDQERQMRAALARMGARD